MSTATSSNPITAIRSITKIAQVSLRWRVSRDVDVLVAKGCDHLQGEDKGKRSLVDAVDQHLRLDVHCPSNSNGKPLHQIRQNFGDVDMR